MPLIRKTTQLRAFEIKDLNNRFIKYDLTRIFKGKSMIITIRTKVVNDDEVQTSPYELRLMPYYIRRMVRRGTNYIEDSFTVETKDVLIRLKPILVTRRKVSRAVRKTLRNKAREELEIWAKEKTSEELFEEILKNKIQKELSMKLKKIYPLGLCEIRVIKVEKYEE